MNSSSAIADLQARWHTLQDLDRALALLPLLQAGVSRRFLATTLNCSESSLRHLLQGLQADPEDQQLFRSGSISRNELVRRSRGGRAHREVRRQERAEQARSESAATGCRTILNWLAQDESRAFNAEQIVEEARLRLMFSGPSNAATAAQTVANAREDELIDNRRPDPHPDELDVSCNARWLVTWLSRTITDPGIRLDAINQALRCANFGSSDAKPTLESRINRPSGQKGIAMVFQKGYIAFNASGPAHTPFLTFNLAQPAAHASARRLRAPGEPGQP